MFFFKQKTAYEIHRWLEFRRVLFRSGSMRSQLFQPDLIIMVQPALVVIDENGRRNVHRVSECYSLLHIAPNHQPLNRSEERRVGKQCSHRWSTINSTDSLTTQ